MNISLNQTQKYLEWLKEKIYLNAISASSQKRIIFRGQVYRCKLGVGIGSEESKERPCVILQHNSGNQTSPNTIVAPITHTASKLPVVVPISERTDNDGKIILDGNVLLGNITCVSKARLGDYIASLSSEEMQQIDSAIALSLDLKHYYHSLLNLYGDKLKYIDKLKLSQNSLKTELSHVQKQLDSYHQLQDKFHFSNINDLSNFIEENFQNS